MEQGLQILRVLNDYIQAWCYGLFGVLVLNILEFQRIPICGVRVLVGRFHEVVLHTLKCIFYIDGIQSNIFSVVSFCLATERYM